MSGARSRSALIPSDDCPRKHNGVGALTGSSHEKAFTRRLLLFYLRNRRKDKDDRTSPKGPKIYSSQHCPQAKEFPAGRISCTWPIPETKPSRSVPSPDSGWIRPQLSEPPRDAMALPCLCSVASPALLVGLGAVVYCSDDCCRGFSADLSGAGCRHHACSRCGERSPSKLSGPLRRSRTRLVTLLRAMCLNPVMASSAD